MTKAKSLLNKIRKKTVGVDQKTGALPLIAFYGRERHAEILRSKMYESIERVMRAEAREEGEAGYLGAGRTFLLGDNQTLVLNSKSSPLEYLASRRELQEEEDEQGVGGARYHTALRLRDITAGAAVKTVRSPDWSATGGGGFGAVDIKSYQLDCMRHIGEIRDAMPMGWMFPFVDRVVCQDVWFDIEAIRENKKRGETITALHYCLDLTAVILKYVMVQEFQQRWHGREISEPPEVRRHSSRTTASDRLALRT